jgi:hypothetical protein
MLLVCAANTKRCCCTYSIVPLLEPDVFTDHTVHVVPQVARLVAALPPIATAEGTTQYA